jgi:hypothetical protein
MKSIALWKRAGESETEMIYTMGPWQITAICKRGHRERVYVSKGPGHESEHPSLGGAKSRGEYLDTKLRPDNSPALVFE